MSNTGYYPISLHQPISIYVLLLKGSALYPSYSFWLGYDGKGNDFHTFTDIHFTLVF